jgi:hypothetical protein
MTEEWRRQHKEELHYVEAYSSPNIIQVKKIKSNVMGEACSKYGRQDRCRQGFGGET